MPDPERPAADDAGPAARSWWRLAGAFLHDLFDLQFQAFITTRMLPGVYGFGIVLAFVFTLYWTIIQFRDSVAEGMLWLLLGPVTFVGLVTALRITLEFVLAVFRVAWYVEQVASHTQVVSDELPRFSVLRTVLFGTKRPPAPPPKPKPGPRG
jgi:hypothetical protein